MLLSSLIYIFASVAYAAPQVRLGHTTLTGRDVTLLKQDFFGGIPFAKPPVGNLRLKRPVLATSLDVPSFNASDFGFMCLQAGVPAESMSEDCLTINIFRPSGLPANASLPVMIWTYGGGYISGSAAAYNGSAIVAQSVARGTPVIYVNFNYRLGPLGFPQGREAAYCGALNLAIKDHLAALEWVHINIGKFGGDKSKVTMFGESGGSIITSILYLNSDLPRFVRAVILESGSAATTLNKRPQDREHNWQNFVGAVPHCAYLAATGFTLDCLKSANSSDITKGVLASLAKADELFPYDPAIDGPNGLYPDVPSRLFEKGHFARLPFIAGTNLDEGTLFVPPTFNSTALLRSNLIANFSPPLTSPSELEHAVNKLTNMYPDVPALGSPFNTGNETFGLSSVYKQSAAIHGDVFLNSQRRLWMQTASRAGVKTFGYLFTEPSAVGAPAGGVAHGSEIPFVYGGLVNATKTGSALSSIMIDYWVSFATSLDPNDGHGNPRPKWEQYTPHNEVLMQLNGENMTLIPDTFRSEQIDYINSIPLVFHH